MTFKLASYIQELKQRKLKLEEGLNYSVSQGSERDIHAYQCNLRTLCSILGDLECYADEQAREVETIKGEFPGKPTLNIQLPYDNSFYRTDEDMVRIQVEQTILGDVFTVNVSPLRLDQTAQRIDPWKESTCVLCDGTNFVSIDNAKVACDSCYCEFTIRATSGDPGYVIDAHANKQIVDESAVKHKELIGRDMFRIVKTGETDREWLVKDSQNGLVSRELFLKLPHICGNSNSPHVKTD